MCPRQSNAERAESTRRLLTRTARRQFTMRGYSATTLAEIAKSSGLTTGALYYHWAGKDDLLADVIHNVYGDLARRLKTATDPHSTPTDQLLVAGREFLDLCSDPRVARLLLIDAPAALGYEKWREIDDRWWLTPTVHLVQQAHAGQMSHGASRHMALALLGSLTYLGREVATTQQPGAADDAARTYGALLRALMETADDHANSD
ncbi:MAG: TetR/AcrR family transcriptional regulator [Pseudonocardiaceae bacterium]